MELNIFTTINFKVKFNAVRPVAFQNRKPPSLQYLTSGIATLYGFYDTVEAAAQINEYDKKCYKIDYFS